MKSHRTHIDDILSTGKRIRDYMCKAQMSTLAQHPELAEFRDLTIPQMTVAMLALERGPLSLNELSEQLGVSAPSASTMVDRLVDKGVITRRTSSEDRRRILVDISDDIRTRMACVQESMRIALGALTQELGEENTRQWFEIMQKIRVALDRLERSA